ncbi:MsnO8 family LLM class oxidoreductase [Archangium primigenium]|uniref:MsnO8 family LLM class oxidoreductase n=1 Tax=[Archangium] primigenium TaxID=2792470 RepID=UPI0019598B52|nr:MsnO8 family LLM class oxidoreductase [Archangium primigenium]MBM7116857.1 MsnO8 family LLM class oxidoreductase [Archangium primigenium]
MRLGILDFCPMREGLKPFHSLHETLFLAQEAEKLGYSRFWMAEHHELEYAQHAPDMMVPLVAGSTERIRVGVAGMLLKLHSPLRVAKAFRLLESLFPGRIDLGVGGGEAAPDVVAALRDGGPPLAEVREAHAQRTLHLLSLMRGEVAPAFQPLGTPAPPFWMLGLSRPETARLAAEHGASFGFSLAHAQSKDDPSIAARYLDAFRSNRWLARPELVVAVSGLCAETEEEARALAVEHVGNAAPHLSVVGNPEQCRQKLEAIAHRYQTDELVFHDRAPDSASRLRCYRLLSAALGLTTSAPPLQQTA